MKRSGILSTLFVTSSLGLAGCADDSVSPVASADLSQASFNTASDATPTGKHLVSFQGNAVPADFAQRVAALGGSVDAAYGSIGIVVVAGLDDVAASSLASTSGVSAVDADREFQVLEPVDSEAAEALEVGVESPANPAAAAFYPRQWHLRAIGADQAWAAGKLGSKDVTVAILDTGIGYTHADLRGLVDLSRSRSFVPSDDALVQAVFPGAHPVADLHYHGTHVAATVSSNGFAAAGVTSKTTLIGVKVLSRAGRGSGSGILAGIMYAADAGADVINMSLGGTFNRRDARGYLGTINRAINYANRKGTLVVVSAGNSAIDLDHDGNGYKTYCSAPTTLCVSATGPTARNTVNGPWTDVDALAGYSNFGRSSINVAAPGGNRGGAVTAACSTFSLNIPICRTGTYVLGLNGTSMASPHVSGLAALLVAEIGHNRSSQVKTAMEQSADDLGAAGTDPAYGKGRINAARALGL